MPHRLWAILIAVRSPETSACGMAHTNGLRFRLDIEGTRRSDGDSAAPHALAFASAFDRDHHITCAESTLPFLTGTMGLGKPILIGETHLARAVPHGFDNERGDRA